MKGSNLRSIRLVDIEALEGGYFNFGRTVLAVVGIPLLLVTIIFGAAQ